MAPSDANDSFETHHWKSEFASSRSGRNSPNIFAQFRRKLLLTPPVRNARSPRLTEEELDALTGDLPYATNYTYAYSKIYDPTLPDHWEVPNLGGGPSPGYLTEQEHFSAASLSRQLLYILRFPLYLVLHAITYILEAFYHLIKIATFSLWDYILYLINFAKSRFEAYQDNRRRTALIRIRQEPFTAKASRYFLSIWEIITYIVLAPIRMIRNRNNGVEQYNYTSIKDQLENERASRMVTRSQTLARSRRFEGLSQSPARHYSPAVTTSTITRITKRVFGDGDSDASAIVPSTPTTSAAAISGSRTVAGRSLTPRIRGVPHGGRVSWGSTDRPESSASQYGLRTRGGVFSNLNSPEPSFDIGRAAATSTPLYASNLESTGNTSGIFDTLQTGVQNIDAGNKLQTAASWFVYLILLPFFALKHVAYTFYDYGYSAYMKIVEFEPVPCDPIYADEEAENDAIAAAAAAQLLAPLDPTAQAELQFTSWTDTVFECFGTIFTSITNFAYDVVEVFVAGLQDIGSYALKTIGLGGERKRERVHVPSRFSWCNIFGILLALLLAFLLFGFLTSDNTAIRAKELDGHPPIKVNTSQFSDGDAGFPIAPIFATTKKHVTHYAWMIKEYFIDLAFSVYNALTPVAAWVATLPGYVYHQISNAAYFVLDFTGTFFTSIRDFLWSSATYLNDKIISLTRYLNKAIFGFFGGSYDWVADTADSTLTSVSNFSLALSKTWWEVIDTVYLNVLENFQWAYHTFYDNVIAPVIHFFTKLAGNYHEIIVQPVVNAFKYLWSLVLSGANSAVRAVGWCIGTFLYWITYSFKYIAVVWTLISKYAPNEMNQVIPIPQAVIPTPELEVLQKKTEVEDQELTIKPSPAPAPIPIPNQAPVIIRETKVVETVDKDKIIKEVTEKLRAELSAEFQKELNIKIEQNYKAIIEQLKSDMPTAQIHVDNSHLEELIRQLIYQYDADKTGQVDFAMETSGGSVISTRCSETYHSETRLQKFWNIPIYYFDYSPRVVIQRNSKSLFPGECWCFKGSHGYIAVELSTYIDVTSISYEHIPPQVAPEGNRTSAPKDLLVWAYRNIDDMQSRVLIARNTYHLDAPPLQFFFADKKPSFPVKFVELEVTSNYGADYTCLYRLRVHGKTANFNAQP
ncbi:unnamed protein product [Caenorhabditis sp. 36 PRJEB53466]|nr:unnamed protein product [Caenorhabditis sp. 36 PRJEB53466]